MSKHRLNHTNIGPSFEQMRRKGMAQHMRMDGAVDPGSDRSLTAGTVVLPGSDMIGRFDLAWKQILWGGG